MWRREPRASNWLIRGRRRLSVGSREQDGGAPSSIATFAVGCRTSFFYRRGAADAFGTVV